MTILLILCIVIVPMISIPDHLDEDLDKVYHHHFHYLESKGSDFKKTSKVRTMHALFSLYCISMIIVILESISKYKETAMSTFWLVMFSLMWLKLVSPMSSIKPLSFSWIYNQHLEWFVYWITQWGKKVDSTIFLPLDPIVWPNPCHWNPLDLLWPNPCHWKPDLND